MLGDQIISFSPSADSFPLTDAVLLIDKHDLRGVHHAAENLAKDFGRVTDRDANKLVCVTGDQIAIGTFPQYAIIVGAIESSLLLQGLESRGLVQFSEIRSKWESFVTVTVNNPLPGCKEALVIAGSDKRGAIFGIYTLSAQIGVSPYVLYLPLLQVS
jgi:hypothetical protein